MDTRYEMTYMFGFWISRGKHQTCAQNYYWLFHVCPIHCATSNEGCLVLGCICKFSISTAQATSLTLHTF